MRAHWHIRRFTREDMADARQLLEEAIRVDPANSMALSDLALAHHFSGVFGWSEDVRGSFAMCGKAARRAVEIDDADANAHTALAIYELFLSRHEDARRRLRRALDLDPNSAFARGYLGTAHCFAGEYEATLTQCEAAIRLSPRDPLLIIWHQAKGWAALLSERFAEAVGFVSEAARANPEFPDIYAVLAAAHGHLGNRADARQALAEFQRRMLVKSASDERLNRPFATAAQRELFLDGLRKAGLSE
jgi:adenylate cyclase